MIDIKRLEILVRFIDDIRFIEDPEIAFLKIVFKRLKNIVCIGIKKECSECLYCDKCLYFYLSGEDFREIDSLPIIVKRPFRFLRQFSNNDIVKLNYLFLGNTSLHIDFFVFLMKELESRGLFNNKNRIVIEKIGVTQVEVDNSTKKIKGIEVLSPLYCEEEIFIYEQKKIEALNRKYKFTNAKIDNTIYTFKPVFKEYCLQNSIKLAENRIYYKGKIGEIQFAKTVQSDIFLNLLKIIGMGKLYALGGGNIEFISYNVS